MRLLLLVIAIVLFVIAFIVALTGGTWDTVSHLFALVALGLAVLSASFLPIK